MNKEKTKVWLVAWATEEELRKPENVGLIPMGPHGGARYYRIWIKTCHPLSSLKRYLQDGRLPPDVNNTDRNLIIGLIPGLGETRIEALKAKLQITTCRQFIDASVDDLLNIGRVSAGMIETWKEVAKTSIQLSAHSRRFSEN